MSRWTVLLGIVLGSLIATERAAAEVKLGSIFTDHMVLQRATQVPLWGTADPGEEVAVSFAGQKVSGKAGADGKWLLRLEPLKSGGDPQELTVQGTNTLTLKDVLVGEVWLCSGQSNMEFTVSKSKKRFAGTINEQEEIA